jgi:nucleoside 2-deoxyribosyltransferase
MKADTMSTPSKEDSLHATLNLLRKEAHDYFGSCRSFFTAKLIAGTYDPFSSLSEALKNQSGRIRDDLASLAKRIGPAIRRSPLLTEADERDVGHAIKGMRAALRFRAFEHWDTDVLHDEGTMIGVHSAGESQKTILHYDRPKQEFDKWADSLYERLALVHSNDLDVANLPIRSSSKLIPAGYRLGTAFIMMWLSPEHPQLENVSAAVKRCFDRFGIKAVRSDDIEHEETITQRILDEIKTAEFLFADLTGERPSVYYEVGYAHALGRRVMLYRKTGTLIHFDLAAYNCPEFKNVSELENKLIARLKETTGKNPTSQRCPSIVRFRQSMGLQVWRGMASHLTFLFGLQRNKELVTNDPLS